MGGGRAGEGGPDPIRLPAAIRAGRRIGDPSSMVAFAALDDGSSLSFLGMFGAEIAVDGSPAAHDWRASRPERGVTLPHPPAFTT
ncbi:hypothetical protein [Pseudonocardia sp. NPDC049635]|uniref:hypothetical protein n=1 Tax=Pseudonocardia sp. NPDC049635 TaxID=3155506 RepID=UPI0033F5B3C8